MSINTPLPKIPFNKPSIAELEEHYVCESLASGCIAGDGPFTTRACGLLRDKVGVEGALLTTSCTSALELSGLLLDLGPGDEVVLPSYTFVSTASAFMLCGARPVFVDVDPITMNMDPSQIAEAITTRTRAIWPVHYGGVPCDMDAIGRIASNHGLAVVEDAAQAVGSTYRGAPAGTLGDIGCFSFHATKNYVMGEGGAIVAADEKLRQRAEVLREKGTDRSRFLRGEVDKYTWQEVGSSFLPSDTLAAVLCAQMERFDEIMAMRREAWDAYHTGLERLERDGMLVRPSIPSDATHNAHMYFVILPSEMVRDRVLDLLSREGIQAATHYVPLHLSPVGRRLGYGQGDFPKTEEYSSRLLRLPLWAGLGAKGARSVVSAVDGRDRRCDSAVRPSHMIRGEKVTLRPIAEADTPDIIRWRNSDAVRRNFFIQDELTEEQHREWLERRVGTGDVVQFIVIDHETGDAVGSVFLRDVDRANKKAQLGIFIGEEAGRGRGLGSEAVRMAADYALNELGLHRVYLRAFADNTRAVASYERAGFASEGRLRDDVLIGDGFRDVVVMGRLKE